MSYQPHTQMVDEFSSKYRFTLSRISNQNKEKILFIMINPSRANATDDDSTIKRLKNITSKWEKYGGFYVGNLYPHISSDPSILKSLPYPEDIHIKNKIRIQEMASECSLVIYAWGTKGPDKKQKEPDWLNEIMIYKDIYCLGTSVKGVPYHPRQWDKTRISDTPILFRHCMKSAGLKSPPV